MKKFIIWNLVIQGILGIALGGGMIAAIVMKSAEGIIACFAIFFFLPVLFQYWSIKWLKIIENEAKAASKTGGLRNENI